MDIDNIAAGVKRQLDRLIDYEKMIDANNFESATVDDMKGNAKDICGVIKTEINDIKSKIDNWT